MNYEEMIAKALNGRSVNSVAKAWGIPQSRLDRYVRGVHMPDYATGLKIAREAGVNTAEAFEIFADAEENHRVKNFKLQMGFAQSGLLMALAAISLVVTLFLTPGVSNAASMRAAEQATTGNINYAKLNDVARQYLHGLNGCLCLVHCWRQQDRKSSISRFGTPANCRRFFGQRPCGTASVDGPRQSGRHAD